MVMYIVPPTRPHRSLIGQPIIGMGSLSSYSTSYTPSSSSSPASGSSGSSNNSNRSRRTKSSNTYYSSTGLASSNASFSRYPPCPPAYENRRLRRRDAFGIGEAAALTTRMTPIATTTTTSSRRKLEMPIERIPALVRDGRRSRYGNYYHIDEELDDLYEGRYPYPRGEQERRDYRYSRRHGENRLRSFSEHARSSGRQELIDLMGYAYDDDEDISSWTRYCRTCR
uniref:Uncharacterized protein n=1 Tax=Talaromyces marneffei PM1 TaxID=1077442 RepID=A0A093V2Y2_TALMA